MNGGTGEKVLDKLGIQSFEAVGTNNLLPMLQRSPSSHMGSHIRSPCSEVCGLILFHTVIHLLRAFLPGV